MDSDELRAAAVRNNALWCDAVCRSHGFAGVFDSRLWGSLGHDLELYPHVITLTPDVVASEVAAIRGPSRRHAVKDSFARLDLAPVGLRVLFEAEWIRHHTAQAEPDRTLHWSRVNDAHDLDCWERAWAAGGNSAGPLFLPKLLTDPHCAILGAHRDGELLAGVIAYTGDNVVGISNLFGTRFYTSALQAVTAHHPNLPIVGYEHGTDLAMARQAGAQSLGPLRIWVGEAAAQKPA